MQQPTSPAAQRLRTVRRRVTTGAIVAFVTAWIAVAALGKGGSSSAATSAPSQTQSDDSGSSQSYDDGSSQYGDDGSSQYGDDGSSSSQSNNGSSSSQSGPVITGQS